MRADLLAASRGMAVAAPATDTWQSAQPIMPTAATPSPAAPAPAPPSSPAQFAQAVEEKPYERPQRRPWVWLLLILLLVLAGAALGLYFSGRLGGIANSDPTPTPSPVATATPVPDVSGKSESEAKAAIEDAGLVYVKAGEEVPSDTVDIGKAVSSDPEAQTSVVLGTRVTVYYSSGSTTVTVPDITGESQSEARRTIEQAGLVWGDVTSEDSTYPSGTIIRTEPSEGTIVERGSTVSVVISSGRTTVPKVVGLTQDEAQTAITDAGLSYNTVTNEEKTNDPSKADKYIVTAVDPGENTPVSSGSPVTLTVTHYVLEATPTPTPSPTTQAQPNPAPPGGGNNGGNKGD